LIVWIEIRLVPKVSIFAYFSFRPWRNFWCGIKFQIKKLLKKF